MWINGNYRRNLLDMHIDDWNDTFLSKIDAKEYVDALVEAGFQSAMVKAKPHTGLCYYKPSMGRMHRGLKGYDYFGDMVRLCHEKGITVVAYYTQIFDNWAYDNHPDWRCVTEEGKQFREYRALPNFKSGRYGIVCPNNPDYRAYVKENLTHLNRNYAFEGMFLDMTFWPDVCYCQHCRKRYFEATGCELPRRIDFTDEAFLAFQLLREQWMGEYAKFATGCIKAVRPEVTVEHQFSMITSPWIHSSSEYLMDAVDYAGGDYYGGFLQQTFINKYYKNVSPALPFTYHTSRCDPELNQHTTTKTEEELLLHTVTALVHGGAFQLVDAINPDGSIVPEVYTGLMKSIFQKTMPYEKYVSGALVHDAAIWFASHAKFDPNETGDMVGKSFAPKYYVEGPTHMAGILRENNIPFEVLGSRNLKNYQGKVLILSHVARILPEEMDDIEAYVQRGGSLYVSGPVADSRLAKLLGIEITGKTAHTVTYISPTKEGEAYLKGFSRLVPLNIDMHQYTAKVTAPDATVLGTLTLPYTLQGTPDFSAIHSNPPGVYTDSPAIVLRRLGESTLLWTAAPIELMRPYQSHTAVYNLVKSLIRTPSFTSDAPKYVELLAWKKDGHTYMAAINQQEMPPVVPVHDSTVMWPEPGKTARMLGTGEALQTETVGGQTRIHLPKLNVFMMFEIL